MNLKTISICSFSVCADVSGPIDIVNMLKSNAFFSEYIPGFRFGKTESTNITIEIGTKSQNAITIFESNDSAVINYKNEYSDKDIISLIELILEFYRQKRGIFTIHGAACDYKGAGNQEQAYSRASMRELCKRELCNDIYAMVCH